MPPVHTAVFAGLSMLLLLVLAGRVSQLRLRHRVFAGAGGIEAVHRASRAHGVSFEHMIPMLLMLLCLELLGASGRLIDGLGAVMLLGRAIQVWGFNSRGRRERLLRPLGMAFTYALEAALVVLLLSRAAAARAGEPEIEIGGGAAYGSATAPAMSVRAGWEFFRHLTVSARYVGLDQPPGSQYAGNGANEEVAYQAWAAMAEANLHTAGNVQVGLALDLGLGQATMLYPAGSGPPVTPATLERRTVSPCGQLSITARLVLPWQLFVVIEVGADVWSGLAVNNGTGPIQTGQIDNGFLTLLDVGWRPF